MLSAGLFLLVCSLSSAVFGFSAYAPPGWTWAKATFLVCSILTAASYAGGTIVNPAELPGTVDELSDG